MLLFQKVTAVLKKDMHLYENVRFWLCQAEISGKGRTREMIIKCEPVGCNEYALGESTVATLLTCGCSSLNAHFF